jgi:hypothetical protein
MENAEKTATKSQPMVMAQAGGGSIMPEEVQLHGAASALASRETS